VTDKWGHGVSDTEEESSRGVRLGQPTRHGEERARPRRPSSGETGRQAGRAGLQAASSIGKR
jgi:hypothetical protein